MSSTLHINIGATKYPVLNAFMGANNRVDAIMGPLGSGKTYGAIQRLLRHMCEQAPNPVGERPTRFYAVRNTYPDLMSTTVKDFLAVFRGMGVMKLGSLEPPTFHAKFRIEDGTVVKSEVIFLSLDREDDVRKLRGSQATGFWLNEMKELVKPVIDMADLRHGRYPSMADGGVRPTWHGMIGDTNAPDEDHWYFKLAEETCPEGWNFFRQPGGVYADGKSPDGRVIWKVNHEAENAENLPESYYERGMQAKHDDWIAVMLSNEYGFVIDGKPVHPEYRDSVHCRPEPIPYEKGYPIVLGFDFGRTPACALLQYIEAAGRWQQIDEFVTQDMSAALFAPEVKRYIDRKYPGADVEGWGDPAGDSAGQTVETTPIRILIANGIPYRPCHSNQPTLRRAALANPLTRICMDGQPGFILGSNCKMTRKGLMGGFCYRRMKLAGSERYTEEPDKNIYSHPVEALEYALLGAGEGRAALRMKPAMMRYRGRRQETAIM